MFDEAIVGWSLFLTNRQYFSAVMYLESLWHIVGVCPVNCVGEVIADTQLGEFCNFMTVNSPLRGVWSYIGVFLCIRKYLLVLLWICEIYQSSKLLFWLNIAKVFPLCFYPKNYFEMIIFKGSFWGRVFFANKTT